MKANAVEKAKERYLEQEKRHLQILDVAIRLFGERGYGATSTAKIAQEAKVHEQILYRHFKNKQDLFGKCIELAISRIGDVIEKKLMEQDDEMSYLQAYMSAYFLCAKNHKQEALLLFHVYCYRVAPEVDERYKDLSEMLIGRIEKILKSMKKKGALSKTADTRFLAALFTGQFYTIVFVNEFVDPKQISADMAHQLAQKIIEIE